MVDLVDTKEEVIRNINNFTTLNAEGMIRINKLKNVMHFVAHKTNNNYQFAPSEFVGCENNPYLELKKDKLPTSLKKIYMLPLQAYWESLLFIKREILRTRKSTMNMRLIAIKSVQDPVPQKIRANFGS